MQIDKQQSQDTMPVPVATSYDPKIAQHHLIALPTRMALMRWTRGGDVPHVLAANQDVSHRAAWYGRMQDDFQSWLAAGGFHQNDMAKGRAK